MINLKRNNPLMGAAYNMLVDLPSPSNISSIWNFGSLLGLCLRIQLLTGVFLAIHYSRDVRVAFTRVAHISRDVNLGWLFRIVHANGARAFFVVLYLHVGRGVYYGSYSLVHTWSVGVAILLITMASAFLGYVLPWGQISFWGAIVITNLFSALPLIGGDLVNWLWGGFAVDNPTLTRFFALHYLLPFIVVSLAGVHLVYLHETGSNNPLGRLTNLDKSLFHPFFRNADSVGILLLLFFLLLVCLLTPLILGDPENFIPANPLVTPVHIQPEWYFLFAYAILRSIPRKLGGVVALARAVAILFTLPLYPRNTLHGLRFYPRAKPSFWSLVAFVFLLTWIGARPVEPPFISIGAYLTILYFSAYLFIPALKVRWDQIINYHI